MLDFTASIAREDRTNHEVVLAAVNRDGESIFYALGMCDDRDIIKAAVTQNGSVLRYASDGVKFAR